MTNGNFSRGDILQNSGSTSGAKNSPAGDDRLKTGKISRQLGVRTKKGSKASGEKTKRKECDKNKEQSNSDSNTSKGKIINFSF